VNRNRIVNQYVILKEIGRGSFGNVKLCLNIGENEYYAAKILSKRQLSKKRIGMEKGGALKDALNEIELMKILRHKNVITLFEVIDDPGEDKMFLIMECAEGGPVMVGEMETEPISETKAWSYFKDAVEGLEYIHSQSIIHRDIKPGNLLVKNGIVKICDFGVAIRLGPDHDLNQQLLKRTVGSPVFLPPELCASENTEIFGPALDIWSLGVTLYFLAFGRYPFVGENEMQIYESIRTKDIEFPTTIDTDLKDLILSLLRKDPARRPTIQEIKGCPWLSKKPTN